MREGEVLPPSEPRPRLLGLGESEDGGPPEPLAVKTHAQQIAFKGISVAGMEAKLPIIQDYNEPTSQNHSKIEAL